MLYVNFARALSGGGKKYLIQFMKYNTEDPPILILHPSHRDLACGYTGRIIYAPKSLLQSILWQILILPLLINKNDVLLSADATCFYIGNRSVVMSRDMLSFEPGIIDSYGLGYRKLRLVLIKYVQLRSLKNARVAVFLTNYARRIILKDAAIRGRSVIIPHGIDLGYWRIDKQVTKVNSFVYVSNSATYKNHLELLRAFVKYKEIINNNAYLYLVGAAEGEESVRITRFIKENNVSDVEITGLLKSSEMLNYYRKADCIMFSSGCENMPNTLLEGMATGLPVLSSSLGPMTEVMGPNGKYYDPRNVQSILHSMKEITYLMPEDISQYVQYLQKTAGKYSWQDSIASMLKICKSI